MKTMLKNRINIVLLFMSFLFVFAVFHQQNKNEIITELNSENSASTSFFDSDLEINEHDFILNTFDFNVKTYSFIVFSSFYTGSKVDVSPMPIWQPPQLFRL